MRPSKVIESLNTIASEIRTSADKAATIRRLNKLAIQVGRIPDTDDASFTGSIQSRGVYHLVEGELTMDDEAHTLKHKFRKGPGGSIQCTLDGELIDIDHPFYIPIAAYLDDIWPSEEGDWDADVIDGVVSNLERLGPNEE